MAVKRQKNWLGQQRVDVPHLREIESAVVSDFDDLAGKVLASSQPIVVSGMTISMGAALGNFATQLVLNTASSILLHGTASEPGAVFVVPSDQAAETLGTSNPNVSGAFTPNAINYIGIDLVRSVDNTTDDTVKFRSATTQKEFSQQVPLARTLQYRIVISPQDFTQLLNVAPVAKVQLDANGIVQSVTDCREMMFRLGTGGSVPNALAPYAWPGGRTETSVTSTLAAPVNPFSGADKSIASFVDFFHAMESRLWEVGGGEHWYSQTTDRDVLFIRDVTDVFVSDNENFEWTGTNIHWKGISFDFGNSTATYNYIADQTADSVGLTDLAVGQCVYVDLDRAANHGTALNTPNPGDLVPLVPVKANLAALGAPTIPGSRHIIAWRTAQGVFGLGQVNPVGFALTHATNLAYGVVKLYASAGTDAIVPSVDVNGNIIARGLARDAAGTLILGASANDTEVDISRVGVLTKVLGSLEVDQGITATGTTGAGVAASSASGPGVQATGNNTRAPLNLVPQTTPTTPSNGDIWADTTDNNIHSQLNGISGIMPSLLVASPFTVTMGANWAVIPGGSPVRVSPSAFITGTLVLQASAAIGVGATIATLGAGFCPTNPTPGGILVPAVAIISGTYKIVPLSITSGGVISTADSTTFSANDYIHIPLHYPLF